MSGRKLVIAIDGPAASGKSTTARRVAWALGYVHVDTGAMYRAVTLKVLLLRVDPRDEETVESVARTGKIELKNSAEGLLVFLDGEDVTPQIRSSDVTRNVSLVSSYRGVREAMVRIQRQMGTDGGVVLEGRDIGTVVFPQADLKIFMVANLATRTRRRATEIKSLGGNAQEETLREEIQTRDSLDSTRRESPLSKAPDAIQLDTSDMTVEQQVKFVVRKAREILDRRYEGHDR